MKKIVIVLGLLLCSNVCLSADSCQCKHSLVHRHIMFVNDISSLTQALPDETAEFREFAHFCVEVNGKKIGSNSSIVLPINGDHFTVTIKSKKPLHDHVTIKRNFVKKITSWVPIYYTFECVMTEPKNTINLGYLVFYACEQLSKNQPRHVKYGKPFGMHICLCEKVEV